MGLRDIFCGPTRINLLDKIEFGERGQAPVDDPNVLLKKKRSIGTQEGSG